MGIHVAFPVLLVAFSVTLIGYRRLRRVRRSGCTAKGPARPDRAPDP